jgi:hypothetical protein
VAVQLEPGSFVGDGVLEYRQLADGSFEFHLRWRGTPITTWLSSREVRKVKVVVDYCVATGLPLPGTEPRRAARTVTPKELRGKGRKGRGPGAA